LRPIATEPGKPSPSPSRSPPARGIGPLLERMLDRQAATGLPPAYLPKDEGDDA
jgi:putative transposase